MAGLKDEMKYSAKRREQAMQSKGSMKKPQASGAGKARNEKLANKRRKVAQKFAKRADNMGQMPKRYRKGPKSSGPSGPINL